MNANPALAQIRSRLAFIESQAKQAQRATVEGDILLDLVDNIDNELREVVRIVNQARRPEECAGDDAQTYTVAVTFTVGGQADSHLESEQGVSDEVSSWLESLKAAIVDIHVRARRGGR